MIDVIFGRPVIKWSQLPKEKEQEYCCIRQRSDGCQIPKARSSGGGRRRRQRRGDGGGDDDGDVNVGQVVEEVARSF